MICPTHLLFDTRAYPLTALHSHPRSTRAAPSPSSAGMCAFAEEIFVMWGCCPPADEGFCAPLQCHIPSSLASGAQAYILGVPRGLTHLGVCATCSHSSGLHSSDHPHSSLPLKVLRVCFLLAPPSGSWKVLLRFPASCFGCSVGNLTLFSVFEVLLSLLLGSQAHSLPSGFQDL